MPYQLEEAHCGALADMVQAFGDKNGASLSDVFRGFTKERGSGLLLHYWP